MKVGPIHFTEPLWLLTLLLPMVAIVFKLLANRRANVRLRNTHSVKIAVGRRWSILRFAAFVFLLLASVVAGFGSTKPAIATTTNEPRSAVVLVMDVSTSMTATDISPTRLEAAKLAILSVINNAPAELNIGLVSVGGVAKTVLPPSLERVRLQKAVQNLAPIEGGTATGEGIIHAVESLDNASVFGSTKALPARIILVSDGKEEIQAGLSNTDTAIDVAVKAGYPVYTVNYGTENGVINGQPIRSDPETLSEIASKTSGKAFAATSQQELEANIKSIPNSVVEKASNTVLPIWVRWLSLALLVVLSLIIVVFAVT
jgi:Ca-activated chloride channel homolog